MNYKEKPRGQRGHFKRIGVTMDPEILEKLMLLSSKIMINGGKDYDISSLIRLSICHYINTIGKDFLPTDYVEPQEGV